MIQSVFQGNHRSSVLGSAEREPLSHINKNRRHAIINKIVGVYACRTNANTCHYCVGFRQHHLCRCAHLLPATVEPVLEVGFTAQLRSVGGSYSSRSLAGACIGAGCAQFQRIARWRRAANPQNGSSPKRQAACQGMNAPSFSKFYCVFV